MLDRASIEKKDFPVIMRGYDPAVVDSHLRALADAIEQLGRGGDPHTETLATAVSEQVRRIVDAAEKSAADILADSEREALKIRAQASEAAERARLEATGEAQREREEAAAQARNYVGRLSNSISQMLERLETMDGELNALTASLRMGTERLRGELESVEEELEGVITGTSGALTAGEEALGDDAGERAAGGFTGVGHEGTEPRPVAIERAGVGSSGVGHEGAEPRPVPAESLEPADEYPPASAKIGDVPPEQALGSGAEADVDPAVTPVPGELAAVNETVAPAAALNETVAPVRDVNETAAPFPAEAAVPPFDDNEGARLVALNMALNGTPREETDTYLAENFNLQDRERLLDDVYSSVEE